MDQGAYRSFSCDNMSLLLHYNSTGFYLSNVDLVQGPCNHGVTSQRYINMDDYKIAQNNRNMGRDQISPQKKGGKAGAVVKQQGSRP